MNSEMLGRVVTVRAIRVDAAKEKYLEASQRRTMALKHCQTLERDYIEALAILENHKKEILKHSSSSWQLIERQKIKERLSHQCVEKQQRWEQEQQALIEITQQMEHALREFHREQGRLDALREQLKAAKRANQRKQGRKEESLLEDLPLRD